VKPITLRPANPTDLPFIHRFHAEQNRRDGTSYPLPSFFNKDGQLTEQVPVLLVGVEEGSGIPVQAIWVERRAELMFAGCDNPKATAFARRDIESLAAVLSWLGYHGIHCDVPIALAEAVGKPLRKAGFKPNDERLAHFYRDLEDQTI
jgi:hypothetical protein